MAVLHVICRLPSDRESWSRCLARMMAGDGVLLVADAVYAVRGQEMEGFPHGKDKEKYVLLPDLLARGMTQNDLAEDIQSVGFDGFVDLTVKYERVVTW